VQLELELILLSPDETALEHGCASQRLAIERSVERASAIEAVEQYRTVVFSFARWPAPYVVVVGLEREAMILVVVDLVDHLGAIDRPEVSDLLPLERPDLHFESSPAGDPRRQWFRQQVPRQAAESDSARSQVYRQLRTTALPWVSIVDTPAF
jgi:hypothetical protein